MLFFPLFNPRQPFFQRRFEAHAGGLIIFPPQEGIGEALHGGQLFFRIVGILVPFAIAQIFHEFCDSVSYIQGHRFSQMFRCIPFGRFIGHIGRIGFRGKTHIDDCFRKICAAFGHADEMAGLVGGNCHFQCLGVRKSYVFAGKADHPSSHVQGVFSPFEHPRQPVDRCIGVGISHGFVKGGNDIVMFLSIFIVEKGFLRRALLQSFLRHFDSSVLTDISIEHHHFQCGKGGPGISIGKDGDSPDHIGSDGNFFIPEAPPVTEGPAEE